MLYCNYRNIYKKNDHTILLLSFIFLFFLSLFLKSLLPFSSFSARRLQQFGICLSNISLLYSVAGLYDQECNVCPVDVNGPSANNRPTSSRVVHSRERTHLVQPPSVERHRGKIHDQDSSHDMMFSTGNLLPPIVVIPCLVPFLFVSNLWPWCVCTATNGHWFCLVTLKAITWWWFSWLNLDFLLCNVSDNRRCFLWKFAWLKISMSLTKVISEVFAGKTWNICRFFFRACIVPFQDKDLP